MIAIVSRHCLALDLRDDPAVIAQYDEYHEAVWPEVLEALKASGIIDMTIWRRETRLVMLIETGPDFSPDKLVAGPDAHPRVTEWNALMASFQQPLPNATSAEWQPMRLAFNMQAQLKRGA
ncbi:L-fucose mutarotase [Caballeronia sordidicola]|uniref:L-fucose mutarotase n=1 Tax=Caballeronia sordidicola TaxID=196367 RepID=A0A158HJP0_CABSO|nr:L-rhamnose mutarotase [Caballeronia sordidicola]SAL43820.1 L-fucose mutarotase [Caballeronia sordidicola]